MNIHGYWCLFMPIDNGPKSKWALQRHPTLPQNSLRWNYPTYFQASSEDLLLHPVTRACDSTPTLTVSVDIWYAKSCVLLLLSTIQVYNWTKNRNNNNKSGGMGACMYVSMLFTRRQHHTTHSYFTIAHGNTTTVARMSPRLGRCSVED